MMYIHKLYAHELGFRGGRVGAGPYLYVPMNIAAHFFPPLSHHVLNDRLFLELILADLQKSVLVQYVYHNDKLLGRGSRNEHRLYLSPVITTDERFRMPGSILTIEKFNLPDRIIFSVRLFSETDNPREHALLNAELGRPGNNHIVLSGNQLSVMRAALAVSGYEETRETLVGETIIAEDVINPALENPITTETRHEAIGSISRKIRDAAFRRLVLSFYNFKCSITDTAIRHNAQLNVQACHIIPISKNGSDHPVNGIVLSRDLHWAFDCGFFTITNNYRISVHPEVDCPGILSTFDGRPIKLPDDTRAWPHRDALHWHSVNSYGNFLHN